MKTREKNFTLFTLTLFREIYVVFFAVQLVWIVRSIVK